MKPTRIAIADDHLLFGEGLANIIQKHAEYQLSFLTGSGEDLPALVSRENPDILILDINLPPYNGLDLVPRLRQLAPGIRIILISMYQPADISLQEADCTAEGYMLKISGKDVFEESLRVVSSGGHYRDPNIRWHLPATGMPAQTSVLTRREKEIIECIAEGKTSKEIACLLNISEQTVKTHRTNIREKLGVSSIAHLLSRYSELKSRDAQAS